MTMPQAEPEPEDETIGSIIAEMIPDGATIQLGLGGLPNAVARKLSGHKDLGIHTELFCPGMVDLIEKGVVTGQKEDPSSLQERLFVQLRRHERCTTS